jgi:multiple sugar transport system permease protein
MVSLRSRDRMVHGAGARALRTPGAAANRPPGQALRAIPWIVPAVVLIFGVVLFPAGYSIYNSTRTIGLSGLDDGTAGFSNYVDLLAQPELLPVLLNTAIWVVGVVFITLVLSLWLAQFLNRQFPGRQLVRIAVLVPWAASTVMTTMVFVYGLDPFYGIINKFLVDVHILAAPFGFTQQPVPAFLTAMAVGVFTSLSFTTYTILAGLAGVPGEVLEAAMVDGASPRRTYFSVILPHLRGAIELAVLINIINVFNNLPVLMLTTGSLPGYSDDTTTTLMFKILQGQHNIGLASALSVINFVVILVIIAIYLAVVRPMKEREF